MKVAKGLCVWTKHSLSEYTNGVELGIVGHGVGGHLAEAKELFRRGEKGKWLETYLRSALLGKLEPEVGQHLGRCAYGS